MTVIVDFGDNIYDKAFILSFEPKPESIQYYAALAIKQDTIVT